MRSAALVAAWCSFFIMTGGIISSCRNRTTKMTPEMHSKQGHVLARSKNGSSPRLAAMYKHGLTSDCRVSRDLARTRCTHQHLEALNVHKTRCHRKSVGRLSKDVIPESRRTIPPSFLLLGQPSALGYFVNPLAKFTFVNADNPSYSTDRNRSPNCKATTTFNGSRIENPYV